MVAVPALPPVIVLYDATCAFCRGCARLLRVMGEGEALRTEPLQSPRWRAIAADGTDEMKLVYPDGRTIGGGDAVIELARRLPILAGLYVWIRVPGVPALLRRFYRVVAKHRACAAGTCRRTVACKPSPRSA